MADKIQVVQEGNRLTVPITGLIALERRLCFDTAVTVEFASGGNGIVFTDRDPNAENNERTYIVLAWAWRQLRKRGVVSGSLPEIVRA